eukprot:2268240-Amphidinium_carterae.1
MAFRRGILSSGMSIIILNLKDDGPQDWPSKASNAPYQSGPILSAFYRVTSTDRCPRCPHHYHAQLSPLYA